MQTYEEQVELSIQTLVRLDPEVQRRVLRAMFEAIHEHEATGNAQALVTMARDIAFTLRMQRSDAYRKFVENSPRGPSGKARPVSEVLADLRR